MSPYADGEPTMVLARKKPVQSAVESLRKYSPDLHLMVLEYLAKHCPKDSATFRAASDNALFPGRFYIEFIAQTFERLGATRFNAYWTEAAFSYFEFWTFAKSAKGLIQARMTGKPGLALCAAVGTWEQTTQGMGRMVVEPRDADSHVIATIDAIPQELCGSDGRPRGGFGEGHLGIATRVVEMAGAKRPRAKLEVGQGKFRYTISW
jgi:hypothetical protein